MASAKKLPSGAWRTQAKKTINGKKVCQSFTVHPRETGGDSRILLTHSPHGYGLFYFSCDLLCDLYFFNNSKSF